MPFNFRALPVENLTGVTENFEQLVALRFKGTALEGSIEEPILRKPEAFKAITPFEHEWKNFEAGRKAEYRKVEPGGIVELRGAIASGKLAPESAFKLPAGYRPKERKDYAVVTNAAITDVAVFETGEVTIAERAGSEPKVITILDPIRFSVE